MQARIALLTRTNPAGQGADQTQKADAKFSNVCRIGAGDLNRNLTEAQDRLHDTRPKQQGLN